MILVIDNYDSFVGNVARYFEELGERAEVVRNDAIGVDEIAALNPRALVISPGPCTPREAGVSNAAVAALSGRIPILGICLGHQCIGDVFGGRVVRAREPMHGRASLVTHRGSDVFAGLPNPVRVGRYHSLIVEIDDPDGPLEVTARSEKGEVMGLAHRDHPTYGVQFHPESILTEGGHAMLANFLHIAAAFAGRAGGEGGR
ncbi:anthranilate synthase component II [Oharaeibacter diazotrophicus]|uniref:Anthranilate synthase component 2/para-aminobenzoate synthetase component 2 n=1 Tax=Oharaeibacter diazotrophicus TaxID=1920512 RepID=A0A4R6RKQ0_9HYPH|nr:aminodeoxychorismate/anthranilate synthase component II [Oharaeibacter diazotrophicus]TDP86685.1 anthranilate synthase component 2/para-aminobenzoate synthetase component 2 [Oharaeibacter diazotrophicus]BBE71373.1 aminodeoxychorismate synthase component 2 [Pleomorphomonas sp. SM30]GLS78129.1 aminodeoxychorismate/anthranilate synthase component II [Oharaeibacter diazotrophicus]